MASWDLVHPLAAFSVWTLASFLCHKLAKMALTVFSSSVTSPPSLLGPAIVTLWQVTSCYATVDVRGRLGELFLFFIFLMYVLRCCPNGIFFFFYPHGN